MMYTLQDYDDEDLIEEIKERGYTVYKNEEMQESIGKLEVIKSRLEKVKLLRGKQ